VQHFVEVTMDDNRRDALTKEYGEVCSNFRTLTDIRFKLLSLLPIATAAATAFKGAPTDGVSFVFPLFGLIATIGLVTYNTRNDQLYDELVGRAASIERSLGLADGAFANRPHPWLIFRLLDIKFIERSLGLADRAFANRPRTWLVSRLLDVKWEDIEWKVDHRTGVGTIYAACIAVWLFLLLASLSAPLVSAPKDSVLASLAVLGLAVIATWCARTWIARRKKKVAEEMRSWAAEAVQMALSTDLSRTVEDPKLLDLCSKLGHEKREAIAARAQFYTPIDRDSINYYLPCVSKEQTACQLVALLTDLPPRWLFDCATNRRGSMPAQSRASSLPCADESKVITH
jgi:hypothetical protein